jgi:hypothetical protein
VQIFLNRMVVDSPHLGRAKHFKKTRHCRYNGSGRGSEKRLRNNGGGNGNGDGGKKLCPDDLEEESKDKPKGKVRGHGSRDKGNMRGERRFNFNAIVKALTPMEQKHNIDEHLCFKCHKSGHRMSKESRLVKRTIKIDGGQAPLKMDKSNRLLLMTTILHR